MNKLPEPKQVHQGVKSSSVAALFFKCLKAFLAAFPTDLHNSSAYFLAFWAHYTTSVMSRIIETMTCGIIIFWHSRQTSINLALLFFVVFDFQIAQVYYAIYLI